MPKAVIFDVDGTLIDTVDFHADAWVRTFRRYGIEVGHDAVRSQIGKGGDQLMPVFLPKDVVERQGAEIEAFRKDLFVRDYVPRIRPFPCVRALFERLRREGRRIVLASSGKADEIERYRRIAGIADLLDGATSSDDAERSKPHPDIFEAALAPGGLSGLWRTGRAPERRIPAGVEPGDRPLRVRPCKSTRRFR